MKKVLNVAFAALFFCGAYLGIYSFTQRNDEVKISKNTSLIQSEKNSSREPLAIPPRSVPSGEISDETGEIAGLEIDRRLGYSVEKKYQAVLDYLDYSASSEGKIKLLVLLKKRELAESGYTIEMDFLDSDKSFAQRTEYVRAIDSEIFSSLSAEDQEKYQVLKNSSAQQSQLNDFYQLYPASANIPSEDKAKLLFEKAKFDLQVAEAVSMDKALIDDLAETNRKAIVESKKAELISRLEVYLAQVSDLLPDEDAGMFRLVEQQSLEKYLEEIYSSE